MSSVTIEEIQRNPSYYFRRVQEGETLMVTEDNEAVAEIKPVKPRSNDTRLDSRPFGLAAGEFVVPADFDDPLPDEIIDQFEH